METMFVLAGSTGDLAKKKLLPALFELYSTHQVEAMPIICIGRRVLTKEDYVELMGLHELRKNNEPFYTTFIEQLHYLNTSDLDATQKRIQSIIEDHKITRTVCYLALASSLFVPTVRMLKDIGLITDTTTIGLEKPFGSSMQTAEALYNSLTSLVQPEQLYFSDHYLGKPMVHELPRVREMLAIDSRLGDKKITRIELAIVESFGIGSRGEYYDAAGALRDIIQNHALQIIALFFAHSQSDKVSVITSLKVPSANEVIRGQYKGYTSEKNVSPDSKTETFIAFTTQYKGIPIHIRTGKYLDEKSADLIIQYDDSEASVHIGPSEPGLFINGKKMFSPERMQDYSSVFLDCIKGERLYAVQWNEIKASWSFSDALANNAAKQPLQIYDKGTHGPDIEKDI